jgi:hypothetical protein
MNTLRLMPRGLVKVLAVGAVLVAATLPLAAATAANALGAAPTLTGVWSNTVQFTYGALTSSAGSAGGATSITVADASTTLPDTLLVGSLIYDLTTTVPVGIVTATTTIPAAGSAPVPIAAAVNATTATNVLNVYAPPSVGEGGYTATAPFPIFGWGTNFANDTGTVSLASSNTDLSFSHVVETSATKFTADLYMTASTTTGAASLTLTDTNGSSTLPNAITVNVDPTVISVSPTSVNDGQETTLTITGSFALSILAATDNGTGSVFLTNVANGTSLRVGNALNSSNGIPISVNGTTITIDVTAINVNSVSPATPGAYQLTVVNDDGGSVTTGPIFTVNSYGAFDVSPAAVPVTTPANYTVTINGSGFYVGATVNNSLASCTGYGTAIVIGTPVVTSTTTIALPVTTVAAGNNHCTLQLVNGTNGATSAFDFGTGTDSGTMNPTITAVVTAPTLSVGALSGTAFSMSGFGFDPYNGVTVAYYPGTGSGATSVHGTCTSDPTGTTLACTAIALSGALAGPYNAVVTNAGTGGTASGKFDAAVIVGGPAITSTATLSVGQPIGTSVALTGTGLTNTAHVVEPITGSTGLDGTLSASSATAATFVVTHSPTATGTAYITFSEVLANGSTVLSTFFLTVGVAPTIANPYISYPTVNGVVTTDVGVGATAQLVTIYGTGFVTGATIGSFTNSASAADANVTAKVVSVNATGTQITADIAIAAGDTNTSVGYTVTNTNGSSVTVAAFQLGALAIGAAPTVTSVSPATATPSSTNALTITGTGFAAGVSVTPSSGGTCGAATVVSATSITVSCTFAAEGTAAVTLLVANADGGSAVSATVLPAATPVTPKPAFRITGVHGFAVSGKSVNMTFTGTGFYGQPRVTSTAAGTRATVSKDHGNWMQVRVTVKKGTGKGMHTFTFTLANGKSAKANYRTK